jgi:hypothetical protein
MNEKQKFVGEQPTLNHILLHNASSIREEKRDSIRCERGAWWDSCDQAALNGSLLHKCNDAEADT